MWQSTLTCRVLPRVYSLVPLKDGITMMLHGNDRVRGTFI